VIHSSDAVQKAHTRYNIGGPSPSRRVRSILICGAGPAGLLFLQYLRQVLRFDGLLLVSEPNEKKRALAKTFGADLLLDPTQEGFAASVREHSRGGVEYLIEASGQGRSFLAIPALIRKQATVLLYGHGHAGVELSALNHVMFKEPTLVTPVGASGGFQPDGRPSVYKYALNLLEERKIHVAPFITHRYSSLQDVQTALSTAMHQPGYIKGVVSQIS